LTTLSVDALRQLRRRVIIGNVIGYAGMLGAVFVYLRDAPTQLLLYGLAGSAVGFGAGLAYLSLWRLRQLKQTKRAEPFSFH
jgi:uncharacterized membrane protein YedE/YeeE